MFVWLFHRISGVLLLVLLFAQLVTGFFQASASNLEPVKAIAGHLADLGRLLSACDPPVTDLALLECPAVEAWLAALAIAWLRRWEHRRLTVPSWS